MRPARLLPLLALAATAACTTVPATRTGSVGAPAPDDRPYSHAGLEGVLGRDATTVTRLLGTPQLDVREGPGRKLQFGGACILDAYLYSQRQGAEPVVTHIDTRRGDGESVDRAACVAALAGAGRR